MSKAPRSTTPGSLPDAPAMFFDGQANTPKCRCAPDCEMPCWQLLGLTDDPCGACGCGKDTFDFVPAVIQVPAGRPIPPGYVPMKDKP